MRFKKLKILFAIALVLFILITSSVILYGVTIGNSVPTQSLDVLVDSKRNIVPVEPTIVAEPMVVNNSNQGSSVVNSSVVSHNNTTQVIETPTLVVQSTPKPVPQPVPVARSPVRRTRAS